MKKRSITAEELLAQLEADPEYQARRTAQEARLSELKAVCAADEAQLVAELRAVGLDIDSIWDLVNNTPHPFLQRRFLGPYPTGNAVLVEHLAKPHHPRIREGIVRALTVKDGGRAVEDALLDQFTLEKDSGLQWVIASALKTAMPYSRRRKLPAIAATLNRARGV